MKNMKLSAMYIVSMSIKFIKNIMSIKFSNSHYQAVHDVHPAFQELFLIWRPRHPAHIRYLFSIIVIAYGEIKGGSFEQFQNLQLLQQTQAKVCQGAKQLVGKTCK